MKWTWWGLGNDLVLSNGLVWATGRVRLGVAGRAGDGGSGRGGGGRGRGCDLGGGLVVLRARPRTGTVAALRVRLDHPRAHIRLRYLRRTRMDAMVPFLRRPAFYELEQAGIR